MSSGSRPILVQAALSVVIACLIVIFLHLIGWTPG